MAKSIEDPEPNAMRMHVALGLQPPTTVIGAKLYVESGFCSLVRVVQSATTSSKWCI